MAGVGAVNISLGAIVSGFVSGINQARSAVGNLTRDLNTNLAQSFASADRQSRVFERGLGRLGSGLQNVGGQLTRYLSLPIAGAAVAALGLFGELDTLKRGLTSVMGSTTAANEEFVKLREVARLPGLGLKEAVEGSVNLQAAGTSADFARRSLLAVGNALATVGKGKVELQRVNVQLVQLFNKKSGFGEDIRTLSQSLPQLRKAMLGAFGTVDTAEISKKVDGKGFVEALVKQLEKLPPATGGFKNAVENAGDSLQIFGAKVGEGIAKTFRLEELLNTVSSLFDGLTASFDALPPGAQKGIIAVATLAASMGPLLFAVGSVIKLLPVLKLGLATFTGPVGIAVALIATAATLIVTYWDEIKSALVSSGIWDGVIRGVTGLVSFVKSGFAGLVGFVRSSWNTLKTFLIDSGIWSTVVNLASSAVNLIAAIFTQFVSAAKAIFAGLVSYYRTVWTPIVAFMSAIWGRVAGVFALAWENIKTIVKGAFNVLVTLFTTGGNVLAGIFKTLTGLLTLDWSLVREGLQNITVALWNGIIDLTRTGVNTVGGLFANFLDAVGADGMATSLRDGLATIGQGADSLKLKLQGAAKAGKEVVASVATPGALPTPTPTATATGSKDKPTSDSGSSTAGGKTALELAEEQLRELEGKIKNLTFRGIEVPTALMDQYDALKKKIQAANDALNDTAKLLDISDAAIYERAIKKILQENPGDTERLDILRQLKKEADDLANGQRLVDIKLPEKLNQKGELTDKLDFKNSIQDRLQSGMSGLTDRLNTTIERGAVNVQGWNDLKTALNDWPSFLKNFNAEIRGAVEGSDPLGPMVGNLLESTQRIKEAMVNAKEGLRESGANLIFSIGEGIGSGQNFARQAIQAVFDMMANYIATIGKAMLLSAPLLFSNPATAALGAKQLATGGALVLAGGVIKGLGAKVAAFANGGLVYGPTLGLVGEGIGTTRRNPEVIAPLDKLQSYIGGGGQVFIPSTTIRGSDIVISYERAKKANKD